MKKYFGQLNKTRIRSSSIAAMAFNKSSLLLKGFHSTEIGSPYKMYVRSLLESSIQVWNPWLHNDIQWIERVQQFFTPAI